MVQNGYKTIDAASNQAQEGHLDKVSACKALDNISLMLHCQFDAPEISAVAMNLLDQNNDPEEISQAIITKTGMDPTQTKQLLAGCLCEIVKKSCCFRVGSEKEVKYMETARILRKHLKNLNDIA